MPIASRRLVRALTPALVATAASLATAASAQADPFFNPAVRYPMGAAAVVVADLNGDGRGDVVTANPTATNGISVRLGNEDGSLQDRADFATGNGSTPVGVAIGDLNGDGTPDVVSANLNTASVSVLLGNGDGTFQAFVPYAAAGSPSAVALGDLNGDQHLDVITANGTANNVSVLLGNGDGTLQTHAETTTAGSYPRAVTVGDLDADGKLDVITADYFSNSVSELPGKGDGTFDAAVAHSMGSRPTSVAVGDINEDGKLDIATADSFDSAVAVLLSTSGGAYAPSTPVPVDQSPNGVVIGDVDADGSLDLVSSNSGSSARDISLVRGHGDGTFGPRLDHKVDASPQGLAIGDVNGDGRIDVATANSLDISLVLQAAPPVVGFSTNTLAFATQPSESLSRAKAVTLTNQSHFPLHVSRALTTGANPSDFMITNDTCTGATVAPHQTCSVDVRFAPQDVGPRAATLRFLDDTFIAAQQDIALTGAGGPAASAAPRPRGDAGPAGSDGKPGPQGRPGPAGAAFRTGARCTTGRRRYGKVTITCRITTARRATARIYLRVDGKARPAATGRLRRQRRATLTVTRALRPGRHRVVVTVRYAHTIVRHFRMITVR